MAAPGIPPPPVPRRAGRSWPVLPLAGVVVLVGAVVVGLVLVTLIGTQSDAERIDRFARFLVDGPTEADVTIATPGTYTLYYEFGGELREQGGRRRVDANPQPPDDLEVTVVSADGGAVDARVLQRRYEYRVGDRRGVEIEQVEFDQPGEFVVAAEGGSAPYAIALGRGRLDEQLANDDAQLAGILVLVVGVPLGLILLLWGLARHSRRRRRRFLALAWTGDVRPRSVGAGGAAARGGTAVAGGRGPPPEGPGAPWGHWAPPPPTHPGSPTPPFPGP